MQRGLFFHRSLFFTGLFFPPSWFGFSTWGCFPLSCFIFSRLGDFHQSPKLGGFFTKLAGSWVGFHQVGWVFMLGVFQPMANARPGAGPEVHRPGGRPAPHSLDLDLLFWRRSWRQSRPLLFGGVGLTPCKSSARVSLSPCHALLARRWPPFMRRWLPIAVVGSLALDAIAGGVSLPVLFGEGMADCRIVVGHGLSGRRGASAGRAWEMDFFHFSRRLPGCEIATWRLAAGGRRFDCRGVAVCPELA